MATAPPALIALLGLIAPVASLRAQAAPPLMPAPGAQDRVLVVAPHPDDESLCCAGILQRAASRGAAIAIVWITAGDGFELDAMLVEHAPWPTQSTLRRLGELRLTEAAAAASALRSRSSITSRRQSARPTPSTQPIWSRPTTSGFAWPLTN